MDYNREYKSIQKCFYVGNNFWKYRVGGESPREVEPDDNTTSNMSHKREDGSEYPSCKHSRTHKSRLFCNVLQIKDILYKTKAESDEYREKHSFFDGINKWKRACYDTEMFTYLLYYPYDHIIEQYQLERSECGSSYGYSSI